MPVTDYGDRFICPGFHDAHLHFFHTAVGCSPYMLMYMGKSEEDLVERTVEFARNLPADAWVVTQGWRDYRWTPRRHPTKRSLDRAFPDRPCAMYSGDGHTLWLNSAALDALGVTPIPSPRRAAALIPLRTVSLRVLRMRLQPCSCFRAVWSGWVRTVLPRHMLSRCNAWPRRASHRCATCRSCPCQAAILFATMYTTNCRRRDACAFARICSPHCLDEPISSV